MNPTRVLASLALALAGSVATALVTPDEARAGCCVNYATNQHVTNENREVIDQLTTKINAMQLAIIETVRLSTGQLSGNLKEQIGSDSSIANVQDDRAVTGMVEAERIAAIRSAASGSTSCNVITGVSAPNSIEVTAAEVVATTSEELTDWVTGAGDTPASRGRDLGMRAKVQRQCERYASEDDVRAGVCEVLADSSMRNASVDGAKSLFYRPEGSNSYTLPMDRVDAARDFILNAYGGETMGASERGVGQTPGGVARHSARLTAAGRGSVAAKPALDYLSKILPSENGAVKRWAEDTAAGIDNYTLDVSDGIGWYDVQEVRARSFLSSAALLDKEGSSDKAIKDIANMTAVGVHHQWELYKLVEQQNLLLAGILSNLADDDKLEAVRAR